MSAKTASEHREAQDAAPTNEIDTSVDDLSATAVGGDLHKDLSARYFLTWRFLASFTSFGLGFSASWLGFVWPANILFTAINPDIGPSGNIIWVPLVYLLCQTVVFTVLGRLSDIFGRRWFWITGNVVAMMGFLVCGRASDINMLIGGSVIAGLGSAPQNLGPVGAAPELVPFKYRSAAVGCLFAMLGPLMGLAPAVSGALVAHTDQGWRWCYYIMAILSALAALQQIFFYFPPTFRDLHRTRTARQALRDFDYIGLVLFAGSATVLLLGLSWGGQKYPWKSGYVIGTIVSGAVGFVAFFLFERHFAGDEPLVPTYLFRNRGYLALTLCSSMGSMMFYGLSIIWPNQITVFYTQSPSMVGWLASAPTAGNVAGQFANIVLASRIRHAKWQVFACAILFTSFTGGMAGVTQDTKGMAIAFTFLSIFAIAYMEILALTGGPMMVRESDIGVSGALEMTIRNYLSSVATAIFVAIYSNRLSTNLQHNVARAALQAGLPESSLGLLLAAITGADPTAIQSVPGINSEILAVVADSRIVAYTNAFQLVYLVCITFGGIMIIASLATPPWDDKLTARVARKLRGTPVKKLETTTGEAAKEEETTVV